MMRAPLLLGSSWWHVPAITATFGRTRGTQEGTYSPTHPSDIDAHWSTHEHHVGQK